MRKLGYMLEISWVCALRKTQFFLRSRETISREVGCMLKVMVSNLSQKQRDILIGLILGDGSLEFNGYRGTRLQVKQSEEKREYVFWLYSQFAHITRTPPQQRQDTRQWYFGTRFYENLENLRKIFYKDRKKVIPENIADLIQSPLTLAVWFMDDGRLDYRAKSHYAYHISTDSFTESEVRQLQHLLLERFGIAAKTYLSLCRGKYYPKLYIGKEGRDRFTELVAPHLLPCFEYKLPPNHYAYLLTPQRLHAELHRYMMDDDIVRSLPRGRWSLQTMK